jgi:hypothetical protein
MVVALFFLILVPGGYVGRAGSRNNAAWRHGRADECCRARLEVPRNNSSARTSTTRRISGSAKCDDLIIAPDTAVSFVIVGAGGFIGVGRHDIAVPATQLQVQDGKIILPGATKDAITALPKFELREAREVRPQLKRPSQGTIEAMQGGPDMRAEE